MLIPKTLLRTTNLENLSSGGHPSKNIFFSKTKITRFEKTNFEHTVKEISQNKTLIP